MSSRSVLATTDHNTICSVIAVTYSVSNEQALFTRVRRGSLNPIVAYRTFQSVQTSSLAYTLHPVLPRQLVLHRVSVSWTSLSTWYVKPTILPTPFSSQRFYLLKQWSSIYFFRRVQEFIYLNRVRICSMFALPSCLIWPLRILFFCSKQSFKLTWYIFLCLKFFSFLDLACPCSLRSSWKNKYVYPHR